MYVNSAGMQLILSQPVGHWYGSEGYQTLYGTTGNDLFHGTVDDTLIGLSGGDTYYLWHKSTAVIEKANDGIDVVYAKFWGDAVLPDNVENLVLDSPGNISGTGNSLDNIIIAGSHAATIDGLRGNDVLVGGGGADVFSITAGNGSDVIVGFEPGKDAALLHGYGLSTFGELMAKAVEQSGDTVLDLKNGEKLILRDVALSDLSAEDFGYASPEVVLDPGDTRFTRSWAAENANGWYVINNMWGQGELVEGRDFTIDAVFNTADMTAGTTFSWTLPYSTGYGFTIRGYPEVAFGVNPHGAHDSNPTDSAHVFPVKLSELTSLVADFDVSFRGHTAGFNVAYDIWFTSEPYGDASTITTEVMVWVHKGDFPAFGDAVGTYSGNGISGTFFRDGTYVALVLDSELPSAKLDLTDIFARLVDLGILSPDEYLASLDFGSEIVSGNGSLTINNLDLTVESLQADGTTVVKHVTGAGTTVTETPVVTDAEDPVPPDDPISDPPTTEEPPSEGPPPSDDPATNPPATEDPEEPDPQDPVSESPGSDEPSAGANIVIGTDADDEIVGSTNADTLTGGAGADVFFFQGAFGDANVDRIVDFSRWEGDKFGLDPTIFDGVENRGSFERRALRSGEEARDDTDRIIYNKKTGELFYDPDGRGGEDGVLFALVEPGTTIYTSDFVVGTPAPSAVQDQSDESNDVTSQSEEPSTDQQTNSQPGPGETDIRIEQSYDAAGNMVELRIFGTDGDDILAGQRSTENHLFGGLGNDRLTGNEKNDYFHFDTPLGETNVDRILDFSSGDKDKIALDPEIFSGIDNHGEFDRRAFREGTEARDNTDRIIYNSQTGELSYDPDGKGGADGTLFARLDPGTVLTGWDFVVFG
ncbi:MAG: hypothetical protein H6917_16930 [Novosphingobium sp.]|nr:hypothetical protein [Novosphingobium sp.]MCP5404058.1 hypothetical protein [Novosphingobium sp.]